MLYATALRLDRRAVRNLKIRDSYSLHRVVYDLFNDIRTESEKKTSVSSGIQWVDKGVKNDHRQIIIVSDRPPSPPKIGQIESKIIPENFLNFEHYNFAITISPTIRNKLTSKLIPIKEKSEVQKWFTGRSSKNWGFVVAPNNLEVSAIRMNQFEGKASHLITLHQATIQGTLTVTNKILFANSFKNGLGRGRSFGCGLLQITPIDNLTFFK
ncbi:type I-E CRISPR-associated protein Cas6/Cse3/CasE [Thorsellia anophelis]|uniref:CRISPR system Cascade subunit CasE n=1 Tax=Thorsellia anophelis DSM 18579 TaxID=1123402 RepID=A0A1I0C2E2_9GAMM|nr:type I-E CRISPR-associated protein Cas6/Cse3/CasE [Thorsellia anophelis]SET13540.1 CRISPR system Cascade subunit CasE [Thorsellia anophelis DSM 18579]